MKPPLPPWTVAPMVRRICPNCGAERYSADTITTWTCDVCGAEIPVPVAPADQVKAELCPVCQETCTDQELAAQLDTDGTCRGWNPKPEWLAKLPPFWWLKRGCPRDPC